MWGARKKNQDQPAEEQKERAREKRHPIRKFCKYLTLLFLLCACSVIGILVWLCQAESGQQFLLGQVNRALAPAYPGEPGLHFRLTGIKGSLPFNFSFGLEAFDGKGLWLKAPENRISLAWRELPGSVHISELRSISPDVMRFPEIPPDPAPPPSAKPMTLADARAFLVQAADFLDKEHWWLPALRIEKVGLVDALLPADLLPTGKEGVAARRLRANADINLDFVKNDTRLTANATLAEENGQLIYLPAFQFENLKFNLNLDAGPAKNAPGLAANGIVETIISRPRILVEGIPKDFLNPQTSLTLNLNAEARTSQDDPGITLKLAGPHLDSGHGRINLDASWQTAEGWKNGDIDGTAQIRLAAELDPEKGDETGPLAILHAPAKIVMAASGNLPRMDLDFHASCADLRQSGHNITGLDFAVTSRDFILPLNGDMNAMLSRENLVNLKMHAAIDGEPVELASGATFQAMSGHAPGDNGWKAGIRDLRLAALGILGNGDVAILLPDGQKPRADGKISLRVRDWNGVEKFVPGQKFSGNASIDAVLSSHSSPAAASRQLSLPQGAEPVQNVIVSINIPAFGMHDATGSGVDIKNLTGEVKLEDAFANMFLDLGMDVSNILAAGMDIGAKVRASGPIVGPLKAEISSTGSVASEIAASWSPGKAELGKLDVAMSVPASDKGKKVKLGLRSRQVAIVEYGDNGIQVRNLDVEISPSGRLRANGGVAPDKLDLDLDLQALFFKPWQALVPQMPLGAASLKATLTGTPRRPGGDFRLNLDKVSIPGNAIPPVSMALVGVIEHSGSRSALNARLNIDPATLKTFGAEAAQITASLPLVFEASGVPRPDMAGPLRGTVRWDGAIGPIWNLLPIPDRRLNGRLDININADGTLAEPRINGGVRMDRGRFEDVGLGILLTDINLRLALSGAGKGAHGLPGGMTLALNLSDGRGGTVSVNGKSALNGSDLDVKAKIDHLKPLRRRDVHVELSGNAQVSGSALAPVVAGEILINKGEVLLNNLAMTGSVTTLPITTPEELAKIREKQEAASKKAKTAKNAARGAGTPKVGGGNTGGEGGSLNVRIRMLPRFAVDGRGLTSTWQANLLVGGSPVNPQVTGSVNVVKGTFDFLGKIFTFTRGAVTFAGGSLSDPLLDVEMTNETPDLTAHILVTGAVSSMKLTLTSDPSMPRDEIISHVLFGRSVSDLSRLEALQLAAAVAELAGFSGGSDMLNFAKKTLGVDVLRIGSSGSAAGEPGDHTASGATVEMGKYINDMIYMGVQQGMKPDSTAFIIQMELTPRTNLEVRTEQNNTWGGIKWKYNY